MANEIRTEELVKELGELSTDEVLPGTARETCRRAAARLTAQAASLGEMVKVATFVVEGQHAGGSPEWSEVNVTTLGDLSAALTRARAVQAGGDPYAKVVEAARKLIKIARDGAGSDEANGERGAAVFAREWADKAEAALAEVTNG